MVKRKLGPVLNELGHEAHISNSKLFVSDKMLFVKNPQDILNAHLNIDVNDVVGFDSLSAEENDASLSMPYVLGIN